MGAKLGLYRRVMTYSFGNGGSSATGEFKDSIHVLFSELSIRLTESSKGIVAFRPR